MWRIIKSELKKQWVSCVVMGLFIMLSAMMFTMGISLVSESNTYYTDKLEKSNTYDVGATLYFHNDEMTEWLLKRVSGYPEVEDMKSDKYIATAQIGWSGDIWKSWLRPIDEEKGFNKVDYVTELEGVENPLYVTKHYLNNVPFAKIGNKVNVQIVDGRQKPIYSKEYTVVGYFEDLTELWNGNIDIPKSDFDEIEQVCIESGLPQLVKNTQWIKFRSGVNQNLFNRVVNDIEAATAIIGILGGGQSTPQLNVQASMWGPYYLGAQVTSFGNILSAVLIAFALIAIVVALIIVRFAIVSNIEDDIKNYGVLKGTGYTTADLRRGMLIQYLIVTALFTLIGCIIGSVALPIVSGLVGSSSALIWKCAVSPWSIVAAILVPAIIVAGVVYLFSRKLAAITPTVALRSGISSHSFKKNHVPLEKVKGNVNVALSAKSTLNDMRRNITVGIVVAIMSFLCVFTAMLHYNLNIDNDAIAQVSGYEPSDVTVVGRGDIIDKRLAENPHVVNFSRALQGGTTISSDKMPGIFINAYIRDDWTKANRKMVYKGRYPENENEICINKDLAEYFNAKPGDYITLYQKRMPVEYLVTGLFQDMQGRHALMNIEGYLRVFPEEAEKIDSYAWNGYVDFDTKESADEFVRETVKEILETKESGLMNCYYSENEKGKYISSALTTGAEVLTIAMDIVTVIALFVTLLFVIRLKTIRERRNIAINKAMGYTTGGLIVQMNLGMICVVALASLIGCILGALLTTPLISMVMGGFGVMTLQLTIHYGWVFGIMAAIIAAAAVISVLVSLRIRRITPRSLLVE